jgi:uncharacterized protein (TIGR00369 family)
MHEILDLARQTLQAQPFSRLLGTSVTHIDARHVELRLPITPDLCQQYGFAHGGAISYLADNALTFAGGLGLGTRVVTVEFKISFLRPAREGVLVARAELLHAGRNLATCRCDIFVDDGASAGKLVAAAQGTIGRLAEGE